MAIRQVLRKIQRTLGTGRYSAARRTSARRKYIYGNIRKYTAQDIKVARKKVRSGNMGPQGPDYWNERLAKLKKKGARLQKRHVQATRVGKRVAKRQSLRRSLGFGVKRLVKGKRAALKAYAK